MRDAKEVWIYILKYFTTLLCAGSELTAIFNQWVVTQSRNPSIPPHPAITTCIYAMSEALWTRLLLHSSNVWVFLLIGSVMHLIVSDNATMMHPVLVKQLQAHTDEKRGSATQQEREIRGIKRDLIFGTLVPIQTAAFLNASLLVMRQTLEAPSAIDDYIVPIMASFALFMSLACRLGDYMASRHLQRPLFITGSSDPLTSLLYICALMGIRSATRLAVGVNPFLPIQTMASDEAERWYGRAVKEAERVHWAQSLLGRFYASLPVWVKLTVLPLINFVLTYIWQTGMRRERREAEAAFVREHGDGSE